MSDRVTQKDLEQLCRVINGAVNGGEPDETGTPLGMGPLFDPVTRKARIGKFYIDGAYGGVALYRIMSEGGGVTDVSNMGHQPKRDLYRFMRGYLEGIQAAASRMC